MPNDNSNGGWREATVSTNIKKAQKDVFHGFDELSRLHAYIISDDGEKLGTLGGKNDSESVANEFGNGSTFVSDGPFNTFGKYGSKFSDTSAFNPQATKPPQLVVKHDGKLYTVGLLTVNPYVPTQGQRISPYLLKAWVDSQ